MNTRQRAARTLVVISLSLCGVGCHEELGLGGSMERVEVVEVDLAGIEAFDESRIEEVMETEETGWLPWSDPIYFDREQFEADRDRIEAFYHDHGYPDAEVTSFDIDLKNEGRAVALSITVAEGRPLRISGVEFAGFDVLPPDAIAALHEAVRLSPGDLLATPTVLRAREAAENALKNHGYPYANVIVDRRNSSPHETAVVFRAEPGPKAYFGAIEIAGNEAVDDEVIRRQLLYRPGEPFSRASVLESQRQLTALRLFEFVNVETLDADPRPSEVRTRVTVTEGDPRLLSFSLGYGTEEKLTAEAGWEHVNFLGRARTLGLHGKWSWLDRGVEARFNQPYFFRPELSLSLRGRGWYVDEPGFRARSQGAHATVTWTRGQRFSASASLFGEFQSSRIANEALRDLTLRDELIALGLDPTTGVQDGLLSAAAFDAQRTTVDNLLDPRQGYVLALHAEQAGVWLPGTFNYYTLIGEARHFATPAFDVTFAQRIRYGSIVPMERESDVPFSRRYFLGGSTSLRGWGRYEVSPLSASGLPIGGNTLLEISSEVRFPIAGNVSGTVFLDAGQVWADAWSLDPTDLLYDAGPGLRYDSPVGPLRLDVAYQLNRLEGLRIDGEPQQRRWRIHFSIGQAF